LPLKVRKQTEEEKCLSGPRFCPIRIEDLADEFKVAAFPVLHVPWRADAADERVLHIGAGV
jgi:hypothetical protein